MKNATPRTFLCLHPPRILISCLSSNVIFSVSLCLCGE